MPLISFQDLAQCVTNEWQTVPIELKLAYHVSKARVTRSSTGSDLNDLLNAFWQTFRHIDHASTVCNELGLDSMALAVENNQW